MPHAVRAGVGRPAAGSGLAVGVLVLAAAFGPLPPGMGLEVERTELVHAEDDFGLTGLGYDLAVGDRVEVLDPGFLGLVVGVAGDLPGLHALKGDALLAEQDPKALVADVVDHPLDDQEVGQLGQAPSREGQAVLGRLGLGELLDLATLGQSEGPRPAALVLRVERLGLTTKWAVSPARCQWSPAGQDTVGRIA